MVRPYVAPDDETLDQALNRFVAYYEQSEMFDLYTHGTGPGLLGVVVNLLKSYLGGCVKSKLERHHTLDPTLPWPPRPSGSTTAFQKIYRARIPLPRNPGSVPITIYHIISYQLFTRE